MENKLGENNFLNNIRIDSKTVSKEKKKEDFLNEINGNIEMLNKLSLDRLKKLEQYYEKEIEKLNEQIKRLRKPE